MVGIRQYIFSICCSAIIVGIVQGFFQKASVLSSLTKIICGMLLAINVITPIIQIQTLDFPDIETFWFNQADQLIAEGTQLASEHKSAIIKQRTQAYILDKAASMGLSLTTDVVLNTETLQPESVVLTGNITPYEKNILTQYIQQNLAIPKESQVWN